MNAPTSIFTARVKKRQKIEQNILFMGPESSGISTAIKLMCSCDTLANTSTIRAIDPEISQDDSNYESLEYGSLSLESGQHVHLIKMNNIEQMKTLKQHWNSDPIGAILILDLHSADLLTQIEATLKELEPHLNSFSLSIGVVNNDSKAKHDIASISRHLKKIHRRAAIFDVVPSNHNDVSLLVQSMLISNLYGATCAC